MANRLQWICAGISAPITKIHLLIILVPILVAQNIDRFDQLQIGARQRQPATGLQQQYGGGQFRPGQQQQRAQQQQKEDQQNPYLMFGNQPPPSGQQQTQSPMGGTIGGIPFGTGVLPQQRLTVEQQQQQYGLGRPVQQQRNSSNPNGGRGTNFVMPLPPYVSQGNVLVEVTPISFVNQGFRLPGNLLCTCPQGSEHCQKLSIQRNGFICIVSLSVLVLSADSELYLNETDFVPLNTFGVIDQSGFRPLQFHLHSQPSAIVVLAYNLGAQIRPDGTVQESNTVTRVDKFLVPLNNTNNLFGGSGGGAGTFGQQNVQIQGELSGTQLSLSYSVSCRGARGHDGKPLVGPGCDLSCNTSSANLNTAICVSIRTGYFSQCRWTANTQVTNCQNCPWGIKEDAYCANEQGGVLEPDHAGVVSYFYYTAFIVLCCLCGLLLVCLVLVCLLSIRNNVKNRRPNGIRQQQSRNSSSAPQGFVSVQRTHRGDPEAAALNAAPPFGAHFDHGGNNNGKVQPPPYSRSNGSANTENAAAGPLPIPRSNASTASVAGSEAGAGRRFPAVLPPLVVGTKSGKLLSPPRYQPLPHLGARMDSPNPSFTGSQGPGGVPLPPPSVSADV